MTKDFRTYLLQHEKTFFYRIKTITPLGDFGTSEKAREEAGIRLSRVEDALQKFDPISIDRVKKTILQSSPLDFTNVQNKEVYILDVEFGLRVSPVELAHLLCVIMDVPSDHVLVFGENDPTEMQNQAIAAASEMDAEAKEKGLKPAARLTDPDSTEAYDPTQYDDPSDLQYGDGYNGRLLAYFNKSREHENEEETNFNADIKGALTAHPTVEPGEVTQTTTIRRTYRDEAGKLYTLTRKLDRFGPINQYD